MRPESIAAHRYPDGPVWQARRTHRRRSPHERAPARGDFEGLAALVTGGASGIGRATAALLPARGARVAVLDLETAGAPDGAARAQGATSPTTTPYARPSTAAAAELGGLDTSSTTPASAPWAPSRTTTTTSGTASWTSTCSAWCAPPAPPCRTCGAPPPTPRRVVNTCSIAATAGPAAARPVQRQQGRGALADPRHGRRPRPRGHPRQLRQPRHRRHPVGRPPARRGRRPGGRTRRPGGPPADGRLVTADEVAAAIAYLASPAAAAVTGTALAVDGGMQGLRLRPADLNRAPTRAAPAPARTEPTPPKDGTP